MTPTERSLLDAVLENPADDTPRLILADHWDENGQPERAEFVRVQIELSKGYDLNPNWLNRHDKLWYAPAKGFIPPDECKNWMFSVGDPIPGSLVPNVKVSRGFPSAISCTMSQFMGGPCEHWVHGQEAIRQDEYANFCPDCHGTGAVPGLVDTIGRLWPIERVTLTDREPFSSQWYRGQNAMGIHPPSDLPESLYDKLSGGVEVKERENCAFRTYLTRAEALAALSDACVRLMRERAAIRSDGKSLAHA